MGKLLLDGVEYGDATAFGIKLDNGLDGDTYTIGQSSTRAAISEGLATVSGTITVLFKDMELVDAAPFPDAQEGGGRFCEGRQHPDLYP